MAYLKAQYEMREHSTVLNLTDEEERNNDFFYTYILQVAPNFSYFYDAQQFFIDSLLSNPEGRAHYNEVTAKAMDEAAYSGGDWWELRKKMGYKWGKAYKCEKDFNSGEILVRDRNMGDKYRYTVDMGDLKWELADSVKNILGYDCQLATTDYHGRKWIAWFTPDIPVQDGPWQLCGLPGLILEAASADNNFEFKIKGLEKCNEKIKEPFEDVNYYATNRKAVLKMKAYSREHREEQISAYTGGAVQLQPQRWKYLVDLIETDYH